MRQPPEPPETTFEPIEPVASQVTDFTVKLVDITMESRRLCPDAAKPDPAGRTAHRWEAGIGAGGSGNR